MRRPIEDLVDTLGGESIWFKVHGNVAHNQDR